MSTSQSVAFPQGTAYRLWWTGIEGGDGSL
jgi:hypothetical protein